MNQSGLTDVLLSVFFALVVLATLYLTRLWFLWQHSKAEKCAKENQNDQREDSAHTHDASTTHGDTNVQQLERSAGGDQYVDNVGFVDAAGMSPSQMQEDGNGTIGDGAGAGADDYDLDDNRPSDNVANFGPEVRVNNVRWWRRIISICCLRPLLPWPLLMISFLNSFVLSFPRLFFNKFITKEIGMEPATYTQYYALVFLPYSFKPVYAFVSEHFSLFGSRRRGYLLITNILTGIAMILMATLATKTWHVFLIGFCQSVFEAASSMVVGLVLIDVASARGQSEIPRIQAEQTAARYAGTFISAVIALPISGCGTVTWANRTVMGISAVFPLLSAVAAWMITDNTWEHVKEPSLTVCSDVGIEENQSDTEQQVEENPVAVETVAKRTALEKQAIVLFIPTVLLFGLLAVFIGLHGNLKPAGYQQLWVILVSCAAAALVIYVGFAAFWLWAYGNPASSRLLFHISIPCIYLFVVDAMPTAMDALSSYTYTVYSDYCQLQWLNIIKTLSSIAGMVLFGIIFRGKPMEICVLATTIISSSFGLLSIIKTLPTEGITRFGSWAAVNIMVGVAGAMFLLAKETTATHFSFLLKYTAKKAPESDQEEASNPSDSIGNIVTNRNELEDDETTRKTAQHEAVFSPGMLYSIYLTCFDIGASAGGFFSAAIVSSLEITRADFSNLGILVMICALAFIMTASLVPFVQYANVNMKTRS